MAYALRKEVDAQSNTAASHHYKISQIVTTQTKDFRWKVAVFSPDRCEIVQTFSNPDAMWIWVNDISRLHTWAQIDGVGL